VWEPIGREDESLTEKKSNCIDIRGWSTLSQDKTTAQTRRTELRWSRPLQSSTEEQFRRKGRNNLCPKGRRTTGYCTDLKYRPKLGKKRKEIVVTSQRGRLQYVFGEFLSRGKWSRKKKHARTILTRGIGERSTF